MRYLGASRLRAATRWISLPILISLLTACGPPRGPAYDYESLPPPDAPPAPEYMHGGAAPPLTAADAPPPSTRPRLFGGLFKRVPGDVRGPGANTASPEVTTGTIGFGTSGNARPAGPLPFGHLTKVCGVPRGALGKEVAKSEGRPRYVLYDTDPESVEPRTQYLTGFRDGCPRQFTASLALFGTAQVHEATRYNPLNTNPYSETDEAYERVKTRICRVGRGEFCPDRPAKRLNRDAVFLSVYRDFGGTGAWMEVFLHKGRLVSASTLGG